MISSDEILWEDKELQAREDDTLIDDDVIASVVRFSILPVVAVIELTFKSVGSEGLLTFKVLTFITSKSALLPVIFPLVCKFPFLWSIVKLHCLLSVSTNPEEFHEFICKFISW